MKKIMAILFICTVGSFAQMKYEDVPKNHWGYKAVSNLVKKGILKDDSYKFRGEENLKRFDFAQNMSNLLNKVESEKANKKDFIKLERLVSDFGKELTQSALDKNSNNIKLEALISEIEELKIKQENDRKLIYELKKKLGED